MNELREQDELGLTKRWLPRYCTLSAETVSLSFFFCCFIVVVCVCVRATRFSSDSSRGKRRNGKGKWEEEEGRERASPTSLFVSFFFAFGSLCLLLSLFD